MRALTLGLALCAQVAAATPFTLSIQNTSNQPWSEGLITFSPLLPLGLSPQPASPSYPGYAFVNNACNLGCGGGCVDDGNVTVLLARTGLVEGVNAFRVPALAVNASATVTIEASFAAGQRAISYLARLTAATDDFVALVAPGTNTLAVPLFDGAGAPVTNLQYALRGFDANTVNAADGNAASCGATCPTPTSGCFVAPSNGTTGNVLPNPTGAPNVAVLTAVSGIGQNTLRWNNVAPHRGVVVVRVNGAGPLNCTPSNGTTYAVGATCGNGQVVYAETPASPVAASSFTHTGLPNGSAVTYRVYAFATYANTPVYGTGQVPSAAGLTSTPTTKVSPSPQWCLSTGFPNLAQPSTELGAAAFSAGNAGVVTANRTLTGTPAQDGQERFRPVQLGAAVQSRYPVVPLQGRAGTFFVTGDQAGNVWVIDAQSGATVLRRSAASLGFTGIQAQVGVQLFAFANAAFRAAQPGRDLLFVASRNATGTNRVVALSSVDGSTVWTSSTTDLGPVSGGMLVDYDTNRLWVATGSGAGTPTLRVYDALTGAQLASRDVGNVSSGVVRDFASAQAYVVNQTGTAFGFSLATFAQVWTVAGLGTPASFLWPLGNGFLVSSNNTVRRFGVAGAVVSQLWSAPILGATGVTVDYQDQKVWVGSSSGSLSRLRLDTGANEASLAVGSTLLSAPALDKTARRLHVGTNDGRVCAFALP